MSRLLILIVLLIGLTSVSAIRLDSFHSARSSACATRGGVCQDITKVKCATGYSAGLCPGSGNIKCCGAKAVTAPTPAATPAPAASAPSKKKKKTVAAGSTPAPAQPATPAPAPAQPAAPAAPAAAHACAAMKGQCESANEYTCSTGFLSGKCPGASSVKCCTGTLAKKSAAPAATTPAPAAAPARAASANACVAMKGQCESASEYTCSTGFLSGKCPGAASVKCCTGTLAKKSATSAPAPAATPAPASSANACAAMKGQCESANEYTCSTGFLSGKCPGAASVKCCTGTLAKKAVATPARASSSLSFAKLKSCYPQGTADEVKKQLGGNVNAAWITNTCAIRMSHTLNCAGRAVPFINNETVRGKTPTNFNYIFRVKQLAPLMTRWYGNGLTVKAKAGTRGVPMDQFKGKTGVIRFDMTGLWDDATGHFDLWDGSKMVEETHSDKATVDRYFDSSISITLWQFE